MIDAARARGRHGDRRRLRRERSPGDLSRSRRRLSSSIGEGEVDARRRARRADRPRRRAARRRRRCLLPRGATAALVANARRARSSAISTRCRGRPGTSSTSSATARIWRRRHGYFSMNIVTTRGCPYHCNWCAKPIYGQRYTARSPEHVVDEIAWLDATRIARITSGLPTTSSASSPAGSNGSPRSCAARGAAMPFKCLLRADGVTDARGRARCARPAAGRSGSAPSRARSGSSTRWRRARASSRSSTATARLQRGRHRGRVLPAVRLSRARRARTSSSTLRDGPRLPARRHRRVGVLSAAGHAVLRARQGAARRRSRTGSTPTISR